MISRRCEKLCEPCLREQFFSDTSKYSQPVLIYSHGRLLCAPTSPLSSLRPEKQSTTTTAHKDIDRVLWAVCDSVEDGP
jgi:hypothetical protein